MKIFSIRSRLIFWIGSVVTLILASGSYIIYQTAQTTLYREIDQNLLSLMTLESLELEIIDGQVDHEWLTDIKNDASRVNSAYIQAWDETSGETIRSPALAGTDLPRERGSDGVHFSNILLPNGNHGRVVGKQILPVIEWTDASLAPSAPVEPMPYYMAIAMDIETSHSALRRLGGTLLLGLVFSLLVSIVTIRLIIMLSFRPLERLEQVIHKTDVNNPKDVFEMPQDLPTEVRGLVTQYRDLFFRISRVREREREFSANVAHELRTPLAGVEATLEQALVTDRTASDYKQRITEASRIASQMGELVNRLMWFSRLHNQTEVAELTTVDLTQIIETRLEILGDAISARGLSVEPALPEEACLLQSDETLLGILMNNLIGNAVAHSDPDSVIRISVRHESGRVFCQISNACRDFDADELTRIFQPFYRSDAVRGGDSGHSGIGLSLSQEIAKLLHIEINARFAESTFTMEVIFSGK